MRRPLALLSAALVLAVASASAADAHPTYVVVGACLVSATECSTQQLPLPEPASATVDSLVLLGGGAADAPCVVGSAATPPPPVELPGLGKLAVCAPGASGAFGAGVDFVRFEHAGQMFALFHDRYVAPACQAGQGVGVANGAGQNVRVDVVQDSCAP